jgi:hypothetical protein
MNINMSSKARNMTLLGVAAGIVLIPLLRYGMRWYRNRNAQPAMEGAPPNHLFSAYRGKFKPHRRKAVEGNGVH